MHRSILILGLVIYCQTALAAEPDAPPVIRVNAVQPNEPLTPIRRYFDYDEANYTLAIATARCT